MIVPRMMIGASLVECSARELSISGHSCGDLEPAIVDKDACGRKHIDAPQPIPY